MENDQSDIIAFLSTPAAYGLTDTTIERHETHGSIVFLAGERAYKLKRAVRFPYMDYSTVALRKAMCAADLTVNRRLAPELYVGTAVILREDGSFHIAETSDGGNAVDWLVVMKRFPQEALLESMRARNVLDISLMRQLGERVAAFHLGAERRPAFGGVEGIAAVIEENRSLLGKFAGHPFDRSKIEHLDGLAREALARLRNLLDRRRGTGYVRRCHGDLHLNNICLLDGKAIPFDAIEFNESFACIDVLYDLAFVLMDLDHHGLHAHANVLLNRYLERTGDYEGLSALPLFLSCRAAMRAHVIATMASFGKNGLSPRQSYEAEHLLDCAINYLKSQDVGLVAIGGVSGTGKSTLAAALAPRLGRAPGAVVLRTDIIRKELWGAHELSRLPPAAYRAVFTDRVYAAVAGRAERVLESGYSVVADAVFGHPRQRAQIEAVARKAGAAFHGVWLDAPVAVLEHRLACRRDDASDATIGVLHTQLGDITRPDDWRTLDASGGGEKVIEECARILRVGAGRRVGMS